MYDNLLISEVSSSSRNVEDGSGFGQREPVKAPDKWFLRIELLPEDKSRWAGPVPLDLFNIC